MNILVDENIPLMTVTALREQGHDVKHIRGTDQQGLHDKELWTLALAEQRVLITTDKGFTERRHDRHAGILVVRLRQPNRLKFMAPFCSPWDGSLHGNGPVSWWSCEIER